MTTRTHSAVIAIAIAALYIPTAFASAASATIQNLSPGASPLAKNNVTFKVAPVGFSSPYYQLTDSFPGSTINSSNLNFGGNFQWVPIISDIGTHNLSIIVQDGDGNYATVTQSISVLPPPAITIHSVLPSSAIMPGTTYTFSVSFPGFSNPTFIVSDTFSGSSVSSSGIMTSSGNFSWKPDATQNGEHTITIYAMDSTGNSAYASTAVRVGAGPSIAVAPGFTATTISPGQTASFNMNAANFSPTSFSLSDKFSGVTSLSNANINASGVFSWTPQAADAGTHVITITGQVGVSGISATTSQTISVLGPNGALPASPVVAPTTTSTTGGAVSSLQAQLAALQAQLNSGSANTSTGIGHIFTTYLKQGMENDEVMQLQKTLAKLGFLTVAPNGYFGPSTLAAVKKFQAAHGLDQLGAVGPGTRLELNSLSGSQTTVVAPTVSSSNSYVFEHFMGVGDDDTPDVLELQKRLVSLGFLKVEPTGYYGAGTEAAVKKFQLKHGLPATGYVAKITRAVLNAN